MKPVHTPKVRGVSRQRIRRLPYQSRFRDYQAAFTAGFMTVDEVRRLLGATPRDISS